MDFSIDFIWRWLYAPPPFPDIPGGMLARWIGKEQYIQDCLLSFYMAGWKDGFVSCAAVVAVTFLAYQLIKGLIK